MLIADRWRQAVITMESRGHQQTAQLEAKISQNINDVIHTQLEKIVDTEMKNVVLPRQFWFIALILSAVCISD